MRLSTSKTLKMIALPIFLSTVFVGCEPKGPAQQAGENIDRAGKDLKNAVDPRGPAEKVGDGIDKAVGNK